MFLLVSSSVPRRETVAATHDTQRRARTTTRASPDPTARANMTKRSTVLCHALFFGVFLVARAVAARRLAQFDRADDDGNANGTPLFSAAEEDAAPAPLGAAVPRDTVPRYDITPTPSDVDRAVVPFPAPASPPVRSSPLSDATTHPCACVTGGLSGTVDVSSAASGCALQLHPADLGFYCYVVRPDACAASLATNATDQSPSFPPSVVQSERFPGAAWRACDPLAEALRPTTTPFSSALDVVRHLPQLAFLRDYLSRDDSDDIRRLRDALSDAETAPDRTLFAPSNAVWRRLARDVAARDPSVTLKDIAASNVTARQIRAHVALGVFHDAAKGDEAYLVDADEDGRPEETAFVSERLLTWLDRDDGETFARDDSGSDDFADADSDLVVSAVAPLLRRHDPFQFVRDVSEFFDGVFGVRTRRRRRRSNANAVEIPAGSRFRAREWSGNHRGVDDDEDARNDVHLFATRAPRPARTDLAGTKGAGVEGDVGKRVDENASVGRDAATARVLRAVDVAGGGQVLVVDDVLADPKLWVA